jgi:hypothetical protein
VKNNKLFSVFGALALGLILVGCGGEDKALIGKWESDDIDMYWIFTKNKFTQETMGVKITVPYKIKNNTIVTKYEGASVEWEYEIWDFETVGDALTVYVMGYEMEFTRVPENAELSSLETSIQVETNQAEIKFSDLDPMVWFLLFGTLYNQPEEALVSISARDADALFSVIAEGLKSESMELTGNQSEIVKSQVEAFCSLPWSLDYYTAETDSTKLPVYIFGAQAFQGIMEGEFVLNETSATTNGFGIKLDTYNGITAETPTGFSTCIKFLPNNQLEMWDEELPGTGTNRKNLKSGSYSTSNPNGLDLITISWNNGTRENYLYLTNNELQELYLYTSDAAPYFGSSNTTIFGNGSWVKASSVFKETLSGRVVEYSPDKLETRIGECWVPVKAQNEKLTLTINPRNQMAGGNIYISSGFVSFSKQNLFNDNSRPRRILVSDNSGKSKTIELMDTPHFQPIAIDDIGISSGTLTIEILDVYQGARFSDLCVNSLSWRRK